MLILALNGLFVLLKSFFVILKKYIGAPLWSLLLLLHRYTTLPLYRLLIKVSGIFEDILAPYKTKYLIPFLNRYVTHALVATLTLVIVFLNYQVQETRAQSFGEHSILYALVKSGDLGESYIEETASSQQTSTTTSYFEDEFLTTTPGTTSISSNTSIVDEGTDTEQLVALTQGGAVAPMGITSIEATKKKRDKIINYEVKSGDTISGIAAQFGLTTNTLLWANNLSAGSYLRPGQNLDIPPTNGVIYTVKSGDTLGSIAKKYQAKEVDIIDFNKLADASDIQTGQVLMLPGGTPYRAPAPIQPVKVAPVPRPSAPATNQKPSGVGTAKLIWPTPTRRISQYYSWRHTGLDIDGEFGDLIWSAGEGTVTRVQYLKWDYGYHVIVDHGGGVETLYAHFQRIYVQQGQKVSQGDMLGEMGSTGRSTGSHLHFEVRVKGQRLNPFAWVSGY